MELLRVISLLVILLCGLSSRAVPQNPAQGKTSGSPGGALGQEPANPRAIPPQAQTTPALPNSGLHLVESYFPLQVGNTWTYDVAVNGKKRPKPTVIEITKMVIKNFRSYYLFNRFPFAPGQETEFPLLRFDRKSRAFFRLINDQDVELYPGEGENRTEVNAGESADGQIDLRILKVAFRASSQATSQQGTPSNEIVFKYGEGIVSARMTTQLGVEDYTLLKAEKKQTAADSASTPPAKESAPEETAPLPKGPPSPYAETGPVLTLEVKPEGGKVKLVLRVHNEKDKMIPLNFDDDQSYDFLITHESSDQPLWRWSTTHYFAKVKRSIGLRPGETLEYSGEWTGLDSNREPVPGGKYLVIAILTSKPEWRTPPAEFNFTPAPIQ